MKKRTLNLLGASPVASKWLQNSVKLPRTVYESNSKALPGRLSFCVIHKYRQSKQNQQHPTDREKLMYNLLDLVALCK